MKQKPSSRTFCSQETLHCAYFYASSLRNMEEGKKEGEVRIPESKKLRNALREMEKFGENKRNDGE